VVRLGHNLPRELVDVPTLEVPKAKRWALDSLSWWGHPDHGRGWNWVGFTVPSNIRHSRIQ